MQMMTLIDCCKSLQGFLLRLEEGRLCSLAIFVKCYRYFRRLRAKKS